jgi:hypothetical protein
LDQLLLKLKNGWQLFENDLFCPFRLTLLLLSALVGMNLSLNENAVPSLLFLSPLVGFAALLFRAAVTFKPVLVSALLFLKSLFPSLLFFTLKRTQQLLFFFLLFLISI